MRREKWLPSVAKSLSDYNRKAGLSSFRPPAIKRVSRCIFCGGPGVNREHIWPGWAHDYVPKGKRFWYAKFVEQTQNRTDFWVIKRGGDPYDFQVSCVDERCNNGWMRRIENRIRPILIRLFKGEEVRINEADQSTIATWIALKVTVQEYAPYAPRISHHTQRRQLYTKQQISPRSWRIWVGRYRGRNSEALWQNYPLLVLPDEVAKLRRGRVVTHYNSQAVTYVIGEFLIHILRSPDEVLIGSWAFPPPIDGKLRPIWPPSGYSFLYPMPDLSNVEADFVASAFYDIAIQTARAKHA